MTRTSPITRWVFPLALCAAASPTTAQIHDAPVGMAASSAAPSASNATAQQSMISVGDAVVDGRRLRPFEATWTSESVVQGRLVPSGTYHERLEATVYEGQPAWRRFQVRELDDGRRSETVLVFDRRTLAPLTLEHTKTGAFADAAVQKMTVRYTPDGAAGTRTLVNGTSDSVSVAMGSGGFETSMIGLVLAVLPLADGYQAELPTIYAQIGEEYVLRPRVNGTHTFADADGQPVTAWRVEVEWLNLRTQDIYTAGDTESGGTYYIVTDPPAGFPPVPRYVNENTDIIVSFPRDPA